MTVPLPLFEFIEADGDVNQITDIAKADTLSVELERKRKNGSSLFIELELMRYLLMPSCSCSEEKWEVYEDKIKQPQIHNLEQFILNLWKKLESTDKYFQTETNCLL